MTKDLLEEIYDRLLAAYGPQHWWPGETPFEVLVGAVLVQNTAWKNVERAIDNLRQADLMDARRLHAVPTEELQELVRPAGYYRVKAKRLHSLLTFVVEEHGGSLERMFQTPWQTLRGQLLQVHGVGPETADSILLYAGNQPSFVVDTYTYRVLARHGWIDFDAGYDQIKEQFESGLPAEPPLYNEYHALLVRVGHHHCRKTPKCEGCPLCPMLAGDKPREPW